jgi:1-acyl-sn-glycerol-3-phosphate acyltransferase
MKIFKEIFGRIWALWGLIFFMPLLPVIALLVGISFYLPEPYGMKLFRGSTGFYMTIFLYAIGSPLRIYGRENHQKGTNYVVVCNHSSMMDVPAMTPFFPGPNKTIAKKSMSKIPLFGVIYTRGSVLVDRGSDGSRRKSIDDMKRVLLNEKLDMVIYPEGTRNRTGKPLKEFYEGAFRLAVDCQKDIIPVVLLHTATVLPPGKSFFLWPHPIEMHLLKPVSHAGKTGAELKEEVYKVMWDFIASKKAKKS